MGKNTEPKEIFNHPDYLITRDGKVFIKKTGQELKKKISETGVLTVSLRKSGATTEHSTFSIFKLLAMTFIDPVKACSRKYVCIPKDKRQENTCAENVLIITQQEFQKTLTTAKREAGLNKFKWSGSDELTESPEKGFYWIPFVRFPIAVSRDGRFYSFMKSREIKPNRGPKGYLTVSLWDEDLNKYILHRVHRVVARVFIPIPDKYNAYDISELQVNHKDGIKINNDADNLEWCLNHENMEHARRTGLFSNETPVLARDVRTGVVTRFPSISSCARGLDIEAGNLFVHLSSPRSAGRITFNWHVVKYDDSRPWPTILMERHDKDGYKWLCNVIVKDVEVGRRFIFSNYRHACRALGLKLSTVRNWIACHGYDKPFKGYLFATYTDEMDVD